MPCFGFAGNGFAKGCHFTELTHQCIMGINVIQLTSKNYHENILASLQQLRMEGHLTDVTVQVDNQGYTQEFQAHKLMLAASSGYFKSALASQEVSQEKISLLAVHNEHFSKFLEFVYTGKIELMREKIGDVLAVAECLDCKELAEVCRDALTAGIVQDSAAAIFEPTVVDTEELHALIHGKKSQGAKRKRQPKNSPKQPALSAEVEVRAKRRKAKTTPAGQSQGKRQKGGSGGRKVVRKSTRQRQIFYNDSQGSNQDSEDDAENQPESLEHQGDASALAMPSFDEDDEDWEGGAHDEDSDEALQLSARGEEDKDNEESKESRKKTNKAQFQCTKCQRTFHYERSYLKHISTYHGVQADVVYRCDTCQQTFANRSNLKIHEKHVHSSERLFSCDACMKTFKRKKDVVRHQRQVHERSNLRHICTQCGKALSSKTALQMHERTHTGAKPFECTECGAKFTQNSALKMHHRIHTGEKPFACDQCDSRFTQKHMLIYHKRLHTGEKPFMCEACGKSFASKEYLRHHSNIHTGSRPYKCEQCGRSFAQRNSLHQHLKIHTGDRPYSCKDCDKQFTQLNALQRHQRIHTGEKPYMCSLCSRTFTDRSTLRRHTMVHDPDAPWKTYLIVLQGNVEDKKTPALDKAAAKEKKRKGKKSTAAVAPAAADDDASPEAVPPLEKSQSNSIVVSAEPVALPVDWAGGAIAVVSHGSVGEIAVINADGTQIQPMVTSAATGVISLDASAVPVPYSEAPVLPATSEASVVTSHAILPPHLSDVMAGGAEATAAEGQRTSDEASAEQEAAEDQV